LPRIFVCFGVLIGAEDVEILMELVAFLEVPMVEKEIVSINRPPSCASLVNGGSHLVGVVADILGLGSDVVEGLLIGVLHNLDIFIMV